MPFVRRLLRFTAVLLLGYATLCGAMFFGQRALQYVPDRAPMDPASAGLPGVAQQRIPTADGEGIVVWWQPPREPTRPVWVYLHGNGANLVNRARRLERLVADGAGLMAVSWRGYGGSSGSPSESGLLADARAAVIAARARVPDAPLLLFGESLGSTVAVMLAPEVKPHALVLDSSFDSALAVARNAYPWLPVGLLLRDTYRADLAAPAVAAPVLQFHCRDDRVTPLAHAEALHAMLPRAQPIHVLDGGCHVVPFARVEDVVRRFVRRVLAESDRPTPP